MSENGHRPGYVNSDAHEIEAARRLSDQIDRMLAGEPVESSDPLLMTAERLSRLGDLLPPVGPAFERRVLAPTRTPMRRRLADLVPGLALRTAGLAAVMIAILMVFVLTAPGQTALARLAAIFQLDTVKVGINLATATPADMHRVVTPRVERQLDGLEMARQVAPVPIFVPQNLPTTWTLTDATAVYYPDLPTNAPLNIALTYQTASGASLELAEYFVQLGDNLTINSLSRADDTSTSAREITVDGRRAILVEGRRADDARTLIWQQEGILLEVDAVGIGVDDLLAIAASMQSVE